MYNICSMKDQQKNSIKREVGLFFDQELSRDAQKDLLNKVDHNPVYRSAFNRERNVRELLRSSVQRTSVSPDLIQSIKDRIRKG